MGRIRRALTLAIVTLLALALAPSHTAAEPAAPGPSGDAWVRPAGEGDHCFTWALSPEAVRSGVVSTIHCFDSALESQLAAYDHAVHLANAATDDRTISAVQPLSLRVIGTFWISPTNQPFNGQYLNVMGSNCLGGGLNLSSSHTFYNAITVVQNRGCSQIRSYQFSNYWGTPHYQNGSAGSWGVPTWPWYRNIKSMTFHGTLQPAGCWGCPG